VKDHREVAGWGFWLRWIIASIVGSGIGVLLWLGIGAGMEAAGIGSQGMVSRVLLPGLVGATFGTPFGIAQWIVLRRYLRRAGWWVLATALGYVIVFLLGASFFPQGDTIELEPGQQVLLGTVLGAAVAVPAAVLQWLLVLRNYTLKGGAWILASVVSWALGFAISFALELTLGELTFIFGPVVAVALSGLAMIWLLRHRPLPA
jgi:hypothetical protein